MINLFLNVFHHPYPEREKEIQFCIQKNEENKFINRVIKIETNEKVITDRVTYNRFFDLMAQYPLDVNIISNLDIYFDHTIAFAEHISTGEVYGLTRWEFYNGEIMTFAQRHPDVQSKYSQDAWIFRGSPKIRNAPFTLGMPGCDNKIAYLLKQAGYKVKNPCISIRAIHCHQNDGRNTARDQYRLPPPYEHLEPCRL